MQMSPLMIHCCRSAAFTPAINADSSTMQLKVLCGVWVGASRLAARGDMGAVLL